MISIQEDTQVPVTQVGQSHPAKTLKEKELVMKRMRWKAYFYNKKKDAKENEIQTIPENYGLKSLNCPAQVKELIQFESNLLDIIKSLKFWKTKSHFQKRLKDRVSLLFTLVSDFCLTCLAVFLHRHQLVPFDCGLIPSFLYSLDYFYFYVYRFLAFKFQYFGQENKIFALGVGLWTIWNTLVLFSFIARLYMCFLLLTLSCFGRPCLDTYYA